jgi:hypothetical protein
MKINFLFLLTHIYFFRIKALHQITGGDKMGHQDKGHFAAKHPAGAKIRPEIAAALNEKVKDGGITCTAAHKIATQLAIAPAEIGMAIDLAEYRITRCQLGLFGYPDQKKKVTPMPAVPAPLAQALEHALADQRIACSACWDIAEQLAIPRMEVAHACEALKIKVGPCQLGAF